MKKTIVMMAAVVLLLTSCGSAALQQMGSLMNGQTIGNVLTSVLGLDKVTKQNLIGTWKYSSPGCAFTSEQLLAKAGGEVAAAEIKTKLASPFQSVGIKSSNTYLQFKEDGTFAASIAGKQWSGKWTFDEQNYKITLSGLLLNVNCYAKRNAGGMGFLFEASKLLTLLQTMAALSGNTELMTVGELAKNYDGLRVGFDMTK